MLVVLPTYKRIDLLPFVIESILNSEIEGIAEKLRLVVTNNYFPLKEQIEDIVLQFKSNLSINSKWEISLLHHDPSIPAVDNWYGIILNFADDNEVVLLHGDDDVLHKSFLQKRYNLIKESGADLLLTKVYSGATYINKTQVHLFPDYFKTNINSSGNWELLNEKNYNNYGNVFIGSHTYCFTHSLKKIILNVFQWTKEQNFIDYDTRNIMFPYYLLLSCFRSNLKVCGGDFIGCIRGTSLSEKINSNFNASYGWNSAYVSLVMLDLLYRTDYDFAETKNTITKDIRKWYFTMFLDNRVNRMILNSLLTGKKIELTFYDLYFNFKVIFQQIFGLKALKIRFDIYTNKNIYGIKILINKNYGNK
jgi:hypothetical protein